MSDPARRAPTMNDVAARAGVGLKTVSRFVNGETNIRPELAERIAEAITALGYRRNLAAASIRPGQRSGVIGLIIGDLGNPYWSSVARAAERVCAERRHLLVTASSEEDPARFEALADRLVDQRVDALVVVPPPGDESPAIERAARHVPVVAIDRPSSHATCSIVYDNRGAAEAAVGVLRAHGPVGYIGDTLAMWTMAERFHGYAAAVGEVDERLVAHDAHTMDDAIGAAGRVIDAGARAILAANNRAALGTLQAFAERGMRLPLIGFDDFELAPVVRPPVSVATPDSSELGAHGAAAAFAALAGEPAADETLAPGLLLRGSELP